MLPDQTGQQFGLETFVFGLVLALFVLFRAQGLNGRWMKAFRAFFETFPALPQATCSARQVAT